MNYRMFDRDANKFFTKDETEAKESENLDGQEMSAKFRDFAVRKPNVAMSKIRLVPALERQHRDRSFLQFGHKARPSAIPP